MDCFVANAPRNDDGKPSTQPPLAPESELLLRFHPRDREQIAQMIEPVALREFGEIADGLGDEFGGLVAVPFARWLAFL